MKGVGQENMLTSGHPAASDRSAPGGPAADPELKLRCLIHDLNNVFQTLVEAADVLSDDPQWGLVSAASLQATGQPLAPLESVVANAVALMRDSMISGRGPSVDFIHNIEPGLVLPRAWDWERVLINLFSNSVRAMPQGGTVNIQARRTGNRIRITVADQGMGIAPDLMPVIFDANFSTCASSGLGLHIVRTIVTEHHGEVHAANRPEGGAEFTINVPLEALAARSARA
jgi:signal transduction histidine kinase